ncbi:MAG: phosphoadenylyl-sulfate reductase [Synechococcus sp. TMED20]|jgi:phosphoadenosine phosphosulfate reductase|nr:MAG: phosphoadenylyl-sulfate reductase [Synechococcus sp. TMED20]
MTETSDGMVGTAVSGETAATAEKELALFRSELAGLSSQKRLAWALETYPKTFALTTSFGIQSAVLLHMLSSQPAGRQIPVIWVDTGYLPVETYRYADTLTQRLGINLVVAQAQLSPARMEALHGRLWETGDVADLELYHRLRKVDPLERTFSSLGIHCWASGVRRKQTDHRQTMTWLDPIRGRLALHPLLDWTNKDVYYYMQENDLPQHPLFEQGYSTVGDWHSSGPDAAEQSGRDTRFGGLKQECGIHVPQPSAEGMMGDGI